MLTLVVLVVSATAPDADVSVVCVEVRGAPAVLADGVCQLVSARSDKALDTGGTTADGSPVVQSPPPDDGISQQWDIAALGRQYRLTSRQRGMVLDNGDVTTQGGRIGQGTWKDERRRKWAAIRLR